MTAWAGVYLAGCVLLVVAAVGKVREPAATQRALAGSLGPAVAAPSWLVRLGGMAELALGSAALATTAVAKPAPGLATAVALCYFAFAGFVVASLARGAGVGCGCFGEADDVPLGPLHVLINVAMATAALAVALGGRLHASPMERAFVLVLATGLAWVVYQALVPLPRLMATVRETRR